MILTHKIYNPEGIHLTGFSKRCFDSFRDRVMDKVLIDFDKAPSEVNMAWQDGSKIKAKLEKLENNIHYYKLCR